MFKLGLNKLPNTTVASTFRGGSGSSLRESSSFLLKNNICVNTRMLTSKNTNLRLFSTARTNLKTKTFIKQEHMDSNGIETETLINQRKNRPISPHLTIYQPQLTWYLSSVQRLSLVFLGFAFYILTIGFGIANIFNIDNSKFSTDKIINWYHTRVSKIANWSIKGTFAYLFALHYGGAIRHLIWDTARELTLKGVYRTGYSVIAFAAIYGSYLLSL